MSPAERAAVSQREAASTFAALGDDTRLRLVRTLATRGPASITHLSARFDVSRQAISKHLRVLESAGLVRGSRRGREHVWALQARRLDEARSYLDRVSSQWDDALARLEAFAVRDPAPDCPDGTESTAGTRRSR
jgi:DNA-binding transcriptional ArsR family regulator